MSDRKRRVRLLDGFYAGSVVEVTNEDPGCGPGWLYVRLPTGDTGLAHEREVVTV